MEKANAPNQEPHARKGPADDKVMPCFCQSANLPEEARLPERGPPPRARFTPGGGGTSGAGAQGAKGKGRKERHTSGGGAVAPKGRGRGNPAMATVNCLA